MGYCYNMRGQLCCDYCGISVGIKMYWCPFDWCQAVAACKKCRTENKADFTKAAHIKRGCKWRAEASALEAESERLALGCSCKEG